MLAVLAVCSTFCTVCPMNDYAIDSKHHQIESRMTDQEREVILRKAEWCIMRMYDCIDEAEKSADKIKEVSVRKATRAAIEGAVCGLATKNVYGVVITSCLNVMARIGGDAYDNFCESRYHMEEARYYAKESDKYQEMLWRDE